MERPTNRLIIESASYPVPNTLYLDFLHAENIVSLLKPLAENVCDADEDVAPAGKKRTLAKDAYNADKEVAPTRKKRTWRKVALLLDKNVVPARKKELGKKKKCA